jgi:hypothetical protein
MFCFELCIIDWVTYLCRFQGASSVSASKRLTEEEQKEYKDIQSQFDAISERSKKDGKILSISKDTWQFKEISQVMSNNAFSFLEDNHKLDEKQ